MVWAAIGWDWKSPLVILVKEEGKKGICSTAYLKQVLKVYIYGGWGESAQREGEITPLKPRDSRF
jgi:hypothetical protein